MPHAVNNKNSAGNIRNRPVDLPLLKLRLPASGIVSIVHRITGVILVILIPLLIYGLQESLSGPDGYREVSSWVNQPSVRVFLGIVILILAQHFFSGIRHLFMDLHFGLTRVTARTSAWATFFATAAIAVILWLGVGL